MSARDLPLIDDLPLAQLLAEAAGSTTRVDPQARLEAGVRLGDGCQVRCGAFLARGTRLGNDVVVGANAVFADADDDEAPTVVGDGARIGAGAVVYAGLHIGARARVRPGAIVTCNVPADAVVEAACSISINLPVGIGLQALAGQGV